MDAFSFKGVRATTIPRRGLGETSGGIDGGSPANVAGGNGCWAQETGRGLRGERGGSSGARGGLARRARQAERGK